VGLSFDTNTGTISGTPTKGFPDRSEAVTISAHDMTQAVTLLAQVELKLTIIDAPIGYITYDTKDSDFKGDKLTRCDAKSNKAKENRVELHTSSQTLAQPIKPLSKCGAYPSHWTVSRSTPLPGGLRIDSRTGELGGVPSVQTKQPVNILVNACNNNDQCLQTTIKLTVAGNINSRN
jgi:hypothetical protein